MCERSTDENPSHRSEKLNCEILEFAARLLEDAASAEYMGYISKNVIPDHCIFLDS